MNKDFYDWLSIQLDTLREEGLFKKERTISSPQQPDLTLESGQTSINFCANNYLGLANHPEVVQAAKDALDKYGNGMASVRFICGTQTPHKELESRLAEFLETEDSILFSSCFDANGGIFGALLGPEDAIISDALNHASIIDGIMLCKAKRYIYKNNDMQDLKSKLEEAKESRFKIIVTDGVFSMNGTLANLPDICDLADIHSALVMLDDSHGLGVLGENCAGTAEYYNLSHDIDIYSGTLGKSLGGGSGGFICSNANLVSWLRQRARTYLFSNSIPPASAVAAKQALEIIQKDGSSLRKRLLQNTQNLRSGLSELGYDIIPGDHPIIPIMLKDAKLTAKFAEELVANGIYAVGFSYPVVPKDQARVRLQVSAAHTQDHINQALEVFNLIGSSLGVIK